MRKYKNKIIAGIVIILVLAFVFWYGGDAPGLRGWPTQTEKATHTVKTDDFKENKISESEKSPESIQNTDSEIKNNAEPTETVTDIPDNKDKYHTESVSLEKPIPVEPQDTDLSDEKLTCILSVRCDTILSNIGWLDNEKLGIIPQDGIVFAEKTVEFYDGESVFNLLVREMKRNKIHLEFVNVPVYNSAYIEGIANIYEFDCGELSGWMYKVNGWYPNYGCSRYQLKDGDRVEWVYTCDLGLDVGGHYSARNGY